MHIRLMDRMAVNYEEFQRAPLELVADYLTVLVAEAEARAAQVEDHNSGRRGRIRSAGSYFPEEV